jgi:hypothetical protein
MQIHRVALELRHGAGDIGEVLVPAVEAIAVRTDADDVNGDALAHDVQLVRATIGGQDNPGA